MTVRTLLVHRDYRGYTGGHGKFLDYVAHVSAHPGWQVQLHLSADSIRGPENPFSTCAATLVDRWQPEQADALLLGGMDWTMVADAGERDAARPIINLVQHVRHADAGLPLRKFLSRHAIRVCVSEPVAQAILATGEVDGPVQVIPAGIDMDAVSGLHPESVPGRVFIDALKHPGLGLEVAERLRLSGVDVDLSCERMPREQYLRRMASASLVVLLPHASEGLYLPGIEAMAMGRVLVQYDCVGSRAYLRNGNNALVPAPVAEDIVAVTLGALADPSGSGRLRTNALETARHFSLSAERSRVHDLLDHLDELWTQ